jgi:mannose-1-phosphate guanylyltransferase
LGETVGMLLCAGLGTRLRPLTLRVPKPAVPVCGVPLVRWNLALLAGAGVSRVVVNVHHLPDAMAAAAADAARALGLSLSVSREPVIAGTGGALREARAHLGGADAIVMVNGDVLFDVDLRAALEDHRASGALATMLLLPMPEGARYAAVETDASGAVRRIAGAFGPGGDGLSPWHFTGVHVLSPALLDAVPAAPFECDVNRHVYPPLMASGAVRGRVVAGYWNDLGTPDRYLAANADVLSGAVPLARFRGADPFPGLKALAERVFVAPTTRWGPDVRVTAPALVGDGAFVDRDAEIGPGAVVGAAATVGAGARVRGAVVWDGTAVRAGEVVEGAIAAGEDRVRGGA